MKRDLCHARGKTALKINRSLARRFRLPASRLRAQDGGMKATLIAATMAAVAWQAYHTLHKPAPPAEPVLPIVAQAAPEPAPVATPKPGAWMWENNRTALDGPNRSLNAPSDKVEFNASRGSRTPYGSSGGSNVTINNITFASPTPNKGTTIQMAPPKPRYYQRQ